MVLSRYKRDGYKWLAKPLKEYQCSENTLVLIGLNSGNNDRSYYRRDMVRTDILFIFEFANIRVLAIL